MSHLRKQLTPLLLLLALLVSSANAAEWFVAPTGASEGQGTKTTPWDIESALDGRQKIAAGDTLWLRGGTYKKPFELLGQGYKVQLAGREGAPIHIRPWDDERVTIDGGLSIQPPSSHLWIRDLEILVSEPRPDKPVPPDPTYRNTNRPWGGLNIHTGSGCKYIHLVIHDNNQGVSFWSGATDSELYGCLIYDNGWAGTDRGHGHAVYTQNKDGVKTIADCIMTGGFGYTMHAYGSSRADVDNYLVEGNICYSAGPFLIGGGKPSHNIRVFRNVLFNVPMRLGYNAPYNEDCEVRDNVIVNGSLAINDYRRVVNENNLVLSKEDPRPKEARVVLRPSRYDPRRANLALFNAERQPIVEVVTDGFLKRGDRFRLMDPRDFFGRPVLTGRYNGRSMRVPVTGEFAAFVLLKDEAR
jgi:hypothetical protein